MLEKTFFSSIFPNNIGNVKIDRQTFPISDGSPGIVPVLKSAETMYSQIIFVAIFHKYREDSSFVLKYLEIMSKFPLKYFHWWSYVWCIGRGLALIHLLSANNSRNTICLCNFIITDKWYSCILSTPGVQYVYLWL